MGDGARSSSAQGPVSSNRQNCGVHIPERCFKARLGTFCSGRPLVRSTQAVIQSIFSRFASHSCRARRTTSDQLTPIPPAASASAILVLASNSIATTGCMSFGDGPAQTPHRAGPSGSAREKAPPRSSRRALIRKRGRSRLVHTGDQRHRACLLPRLREPAAFDGKTSHRRPRRRDLERTRGTLNSIS